MAETTGRRKSELQELYLTAHVLKGSVFMPKKALKIEGLWVRRTLIFDLNQRAATVLTKDVANGGKVVQTILLSDVVLADVSALRGAGKRDDGGAVEHTLVVVCRKSPQLQLCAATQLEASAWAAAFAAVVAA